MKKTKSDGIFAFVLIAIIIVLALLIIKSVLKEETVYPGVIGISGSATPTPQPGLRPEAESDSLLPVFYSASTNQKRVALTVQNLPSAAAMDTLLGGCETFGAKLTFFVTGNELKSNAEIWQLVSLAGHEVESRGLTGDSTMLMTNDELATELDCFDTPIKERFGEEYETHFYRPSTFDDYDDERLHYYLKQRGYYGICSFSLMSPSKLEQFECGTIVNVNLSEYGVSTFLKMVSALSEDGWEMVTLNTLFEYPENIIHSEEISLTY